MFESIENFFNKRPSLIANRTDELSGCHGAILATDGFEESELFDTKSALEAAGAKIDVVAPHLGKIRGWKNKNWGKSISVDMTVRDAWAVEFDFLVIPGGVINPDELRTDVEAVALVMSFVNKRRPIAAICHGVQLLIETGSLEGKRLTSWPSLKTDLSNAGANWVDKDVVIDQKLITSRKPDDIPAFNQAMIREFQYGKNHGHLPNVEGYVATL